MALAKTELIEVFVSRVPSSDGASGSPAPVTLDADDLSTEDMRALAEHYGHEAGFVLRPTDPKTADVRYRFFVPRHEMDMCGHATLGTTWLLNKLGRVKPGDIRIETLSGVVHARVSPSGEVAISQPKGIVSVVEESHRAEIMDVLGITAADMLDQPIINASTSRVKTLVALTSPTAVNGLKPDFERMEALCTKLGSTGLYPFACDWDDERTYHARQFPSNSGYPEDPATGIAASALIYGLQHYGLIGTRRTIRVRQGEAMGRPSRIAVTLANARDVDAGCWLSGDVRTASRV
jgi:trans-2,3-dihydro-3-hydroxyanthranilate isomerase